MLQDNPHCPVTAAKASIKSASCFCYTPQGDNHFTDFRSHIIEGIKHQVTKMGSNLQANLLVYALPVILLVQIGDAANQ